MSYTNKGNIQNYLMIDIDSSFDTTIANWISGAETYINNYTGKKDGFETTTTEDRYFDGNGKREIIIDDFLTLNSVEILEANGGDVEWTLTEGQENDYIKYPYNLTPYYKLILVSTSQVGSWYTGDKRIKINALWGNSSSVPKDIEYACTILVASMVEKGLKGGKVASESLGDYSVSFEKIQDSAQAMGVEKILQHYKIIEL